MTTKWKSMLWLLTVMGVAGCGTTMKGGGAAVEVRSSKEVLLTNVSVKLDDGLLYVSGTFRPTSSVVRRAGHVDVELIGECGEVLDTFRAEQHIHQFSRSSSRKPIFSAVVPAEPSRIRTVRLIHHVDALEACGL